MEKSGDDEPGGEDEHWDEVVEDQVVKGVHLEKRRKWEKLFIETLLYLEHWYVTCSPENVVVVHRTKIYKDVQRFH